jgi:hypothetical protein
MITTQHIFLLRLCFVCKKLKSFKGIDCTTKLTHKARIQIMQVYDIISYTTVVNKETNRRSKSLFQNILLKKANSKLIHDMVHADDDKETVMFVRYNTTQESTANKVANYLM